MFKNLKDVIAGRKSVTITVQSTPTTLSPSQMMDHAMMQAFERSQRIRDISFFTK